MAILSVRAFTWHGFNQMGPKARRTWKRGQ